MAGVLGVLRETYMPLEKAREVTEWESWKKL